MQARKQSLILGGNGALGKAMVNTFKAGGWRTVNLDLQTNNDACANIIVNQDISMKAQVASLLSQSQKATPEYDAIICVAGGFGLSSIKDRDIMERYEEQDRINFQSALLAGHLASLQLAPRGFLMFSGAAAVFNGPVNFAYAYAMSKAATHSLALHLAQRGELAEDSNVCTILPGVIDTPANRSAMPDADMSEWAPPEKIAQMVRQWADGENRPLNGSFARVEYKNSVVYPTFV